MRLSYNQLLCYLAKGFRKFIKKRKPERKEQKKEERELYIAMNIWTRELITDRNAASN